MKIFDKSKADEFYYKPLKKRVPKYRTSALLKALFDTENLTITSATALALQGYEFVMESGGKLLAVVPPSGLGGYQ